MRVKGPEALGLFPEIEDEEFTATILMLSDVFDAVRPLNLVLQKGDGSLCLSDLSMYLNKTLLALEKLHDENKRVWFNRKKFLKMQTTAGERMLSLPPSANLQNSVNFLLKNFAMKHILALLRDSSRKSKKRSNNLTFG